MGSESRQDANISGRTNTMHIVVGVLGDVVALVASVVISVLVDEVVVDVVVIVVAVVVVGLVVVVRSSW